MKRSLPLLCFAVSLLLAAIGFPILAQASEKTGVAAGVVGMVEISGGVRAAPQVLKSGMAIMVGDRIQSRANSRLQIMLVDETVFSLGPDSDLVIDEFMFEPSATSGINGAAQQGRITVSAGKGLLRYVSGQVASGNPDGVTIKTPSALLGVRGTALFVIDDPQSGDGAQFIGLLGPGDRNNGNLKVGGMTVTSGEGDGDTIDIDRAGFGVMTAPGQEVGESQPTPARFVRQMAQNLTGPPAAAVADVATAGGPAPPAGNVSRASGQQVADTRLSAAGVGEVIGILDEGLDKTSKASEQQAAAVLANVPMPEIAGLLPLEVEIPGMIELSWASPGVLDLDLHLSGPDGSVNGDPAGLPGRFHIFSGNPGSYDLAPFAALDNNASGLAGSEVVGISKFNAGAAYRAEVSGVKITPETLANPENKIQIRYVSSGLLTRGPNGSTAIKGVEVIRFSPNQGQLGVTWTAFDITPGPAVKITTINVITNVAPGTFK